MTEVGAEAVAAGLGPPEGGVVDMVTEDKGTEVRKGDEDTEMGDEEEKKTSGEGGLKGEGKDEIQTEVVGNGKDIGEKKTSVEGDVKGEENGKGKEETQTDDAGTVEVGNAKYVEEKKPGENDVKGEEKEEMQTEDAGTVENGDSKNEEKTEAEREKPGKGSDAKEEKNSGDGEKKVNESMELESEDKEGEKPKKENDAKEEKDSEKMLENEENEGEKPEKENDVKEEKDNVEGETKVNESVESESEEDEEEKPEKEIDAKEEKDSGDDKKKIDEMVSELPKKKRARSRKVSEERNKKEKKESLVKAKGSPKTPALSIERPVRERKSVERLVEVIDKGQNKEFLIEKGRGIPLKDIPNVAYKIGKKKSADLKLLHQTLFGRRGKAVNFKNHILQFSGFAWHDGDDKQNAKMKDKLDKYVKDTLLDICDLLDIPVSRATTKKEDLVVKLLDFMVAPHVTNDVILAEKDQQSSKSRKRKSVSRGTPRSTGSMSDKRKKRAKVEGTPRAEETEDDEEEDEMDSDNGLPDEDEHYKHPGNDEMEIESEEADEDDDEHVKKGKRDIKSSSKQRGSARKEKIGTSPKKVPPTTSKSPSKHPAEGKNDVGTKVFSRKKKNIDAPKLESTPKPNKKEKTTGKRRSTGKGKTEETKQSGPSKEELRKTICEILKEVDFNTATFTDILKQLATRYKIDLTPRKSSIKQMIQEELTRLADEAEESEEDEDENPKSTGKELEA